MSFQKIQKMDLENKGLKMFDELKHGGRNTRTKIITWAIFGAIILVFVLWGLSPRSGGGLMGTGGGVAHVNSATISMRELNDAVTQMEQNMQGSPYASFFQGEAGRQRMQEMALNQLVQSELIYQACVANQLVSSDSAIAEIIRSAPIFNENGKFQRDRYMSYIENMRTTPSEFEEKLRRGAISQDAQRVFSLALRATPQEVKKQMDLRDLQADVEYVELQTSKLVSADQVSAAEVKAFLAQTDSEKKLKDYYSTHASEFNTEEKIHARHILVKFDPANSESVKIAEKKAEDLLSKLKKGEDFSKLATENSDDPGSKAKGGELEAFSRGKMVAEFEKTAFSLKPKTLSDLVKTKYGFHIIEVIDKIPKATTSLDTAKAGIAKNLAAEKKSEAMMGEIRDLLKKSDLKGVDQFVSTYKLKWDSTGPFSISAATVPKVGGNDEFAKVGFRLNEKAPLATELVRQGDKAYIMKFKAVSKSALAKDSITTAAKKSKLAKNTKNDAEIKLETPEELAKNIAFQRSQDAFTGWIDAVRKSSRVEMTKNFAASQNEAPGDY